MTTTRFDGGRTRVSSSLSAGFRPRPAHPGPLLWGTLGFIALGFVLPAYAIPHLQLNHATTAIAAGIVLYAAFRLSMLLVRGEPRLLATAFWTFVYSFLTLPLLAQITARQFPLATIFTYNDATINTTEFIIIVGIVGYEGARLIGERRLAHPTPHLDAGKLSTTISVRRAAFIGYVGLLFVMIAVWQHGLGSFFTSRDALTQNFLGPAAIGQKFYLNQNKASGASLLALSQVPTFIGAYLLLYVRHTRRRDLPKAPAPSWWLIAPLLVGNVIINNPIANARFWYGTVLISFLTIYLPLRERRNAARLFVLAFVFTSLFSFHQLQAFRRTAAADFTRQPLPATLIADPDYASAQQVMNGVSYIHEHGVGYGHQLLGTALVWFPKALWTAKPGDTGQLVGGSAGFKVAAPIWTEGEVDFGYGGTFLYLAAVGTFVVIFDRRYAQSRAHANILAASTPIMASLLVFVLRGSLQPAFGSLIPVVASIVFCIGRRPLVTRSPSTSRLEGGSCEPAPSEPDAGKTHASDSR